MDNADLRHTGLGCDNHLLILTGDSVFDATPDGFVPADDALTLGGYGVGLHGGEEYGTPRSKGSFALSRAYSFSLAPWGEDLLALASFDGKLYRWTPQSPTDKAAVISQAPTGNRAVSVTDERHVLLLGAGGNPRRIAWCSRENYTDWDFLSVTNTAGFLDLPTNGLPVGLTKVREGHLVFTEMDAFLIRFVGSPFIYTYEKIGETTSILSPNAVADFGGRAVWMGREGFFIYDGGFVKPLPSDVGSFIYETMDPLFGIFRTHASTNGAFPEIWWFFPSKGATECDRYVVWNYEEGWWTIGRLERTAMQPAGVEKFPLMAGTDRHLYQHESGLTAAGFRRAQDVWIKSAPFMVGDGSQQMDVVQAFPDITCHDRRGVSFNFDVRTTPDGPATRKGPYFIRPDGYMDMRWGGREAQLILQGEDDCEWSVGTPRLEVRPRGAR
ncbi:hypothetical protein [Enterovirga aerilata]|uniref:Uncharacterized protein n=1 Tax=Enterovirga aerilata TaxID=2730920 RepID=A0A849IEU2_9HYPH|nr:hypothetical protein [Enterovirga sp. DB1703]NNM74745.1 hypothetical protein [Enterovirga sp. DB1703]